MWARILRRNGVAFIAIKRVQNAAFQCSLKNNRMISVRFQGKPFNITVSKSMTHPLMLKKLKLHGSLRPTRSSKTNTKRDVLFIIGDWNAKEGSQETPGVTGKFGLGIRNEAGQKLI